MSACVMLAAGCTTAVPTAPAVPSSPAENVTVEKAWPHITSFSASIEDINPGENVTLKWNTGGGDTVTITPGIGTVSPVGSIIVFPQSTTKYELTAANSSGRSQGWVTVNVKTAPVLLPDLVITSVTYNSGLLYYTVKNIGTADAGPSNTWLYDMSHMQRDQSWVSGLKVGEEKKGEFSNYQYTGTEITICADGGKDVVESNEDNNCNIPSWGAKFTYDMQQYATRASWRSSNGSTPFGEKSVSTTGMVDKVNEVMMEDGKSYRNGIVMVPPPESYSWIEGQFGETVEQWQTGSYMIPMSVPLNTHFTARVGLTREAQGGNGVTFIFGLVGADGTRNYWPGVKAAYDGKLESIDIDLSPYAGKKVMALLRIEAGPDTEKNYAAWVDARISQ